MYSTSSSSVYVEDILTGLQILPKMCTETLEMIEQMDRTVIDLSRLIDADMTAPPDQKQRFQKEDLQVIRKMIEDLSDRKAQLAVRNYDLIDHNIRIVDQELNLVETSMTLNGYGQQFNALTNNIDNKIVSSTTGKKRKSAAVDSTIPLQSVDPNEPVYCLCKQIAFGEMIACDNEECRIEWFHYGCVNLTKKPRNAWYCSTCAQKNK